MSYTFENPDYVQFFLDNQIGPMEEFQVIFMKKDGTQRKLVGHLDPNGSTRKENVPVQTEEGWKSFNINRVLLIQHAD